MSPLIRNFIIILGLVVISTLIAMPSSVPVSFNIFGYQVDQVLERPYFFDFELQQGLDIQGGMQVVLEAQMNDIPEEDRETALESARSVIARRVDLFGVSEPVVQTARQGESYRIIVELPGVQDPQRALQLVGTTAQLDFRLLQQPDISPEATTSAQVGLEDFKSVGLTGSNLERSQIQFDPQTGEPVVSLEFDQEGTEIFSDTTSNHTGETLGIFLDDSPLMLPTIQDPITSGQAVITGDFSVEEAKQLSIQLNAGALPVDIEILEQRTIGASLGQESVQASIRAGLIGLALVMIFMMANYGIRGMLSNLALLLYGLLTIAIYKLLSVTLTLPGIAGLLLSIGMAVDANILIFERMKEENRMGKPLEKVIELGFGRAWDSIKDANVATLVTAFILINPLNFAFLNTSGLVRGFGVTLFVGVLISLFTGVFVTRTLLKLFLQP